MSETLTPRVELDADGRMVRAYIPSNSRPGAGYAMARTVGGHWEHTNTECRGWVEFGHCRHIAELEDFTMSDESQELAIAVPFSPLALLDAVELEEVMASKLVPSERHIYQFRVKGQMVEGVSIDGVRDAARALSTKGEAIREMWARMEREDDREAYFLACSGRFAISPNGQEICMDTAIRAKRQPKWAKKADGSGEYFIDMWFEIGIAKAARNATEALLPEQLKEWLKSKARDLVGKSNNSQPAKGSVSQPTAAQRAATRAAQQPRTQAAAKPEAKAEATSAAPKQHPAQRVQELLKRARTEMDAGSYSNLFTLIRKAWPEAYDGDMMALSGVGSDITAAIADFIVKALDGVPPEVASPRQAELVR